MFDKLKATGLKWTRQAQSGVRLFDFWNHRLGIAVEVDGLEHDACVDSARDYAVMKNRSVLVLRVRNFNEGDAAEAIRAIELSESWNARRRAAGLPPINGAD